MIILGGNHFRFWQQQTTGAYFLSVSVEEWAGDGHHVVVNGYDIGNHFSVLRAVLLIICTYYRAWSTHDGCQRHNFVQRRQVHYLSLLHRQFAPSGLGWYGICPILSRFCAYMRPGFLVL